MLVLVAVARDAHERAVDGFQRVWQRARPVVRQVVTAALLLVGAALLLDVGWWAATGAFLLVPP